MSTVRAILAGVRRAATFPGMLVALWLFNLAAAVPAAWVVTDSIRQSVGASRVQENLRTGFDMEWFGQYEFAARGIARTFTPTVLGAGAMFDNLEGWITGRMFTGFGGLIGLGVVYGLLWTFLLGGVVERFADPEGTHSISRFFGAAGTFFFRFARLAVISGVLYGGVYGLQLWLYRRLETWARDVTEERTVFVYAMIVTLGAALLLIVVHLAFAYAKIATVVEDRRSMALAAIRGFRFVLSNPIRTLGLYFGLGLVSLALLAAYHFLAPGAAQETYGEVLLAFLFAQLLLIVRLGVRLATLGGAVALYTWDGSPPAAVSVEDRLAA